MKSLYNSLRYYGLAVFQLGMMPKRMYPYEAQQEHWSQLISNIEKSGFESIHIYSETKVVKMKSENMPMMITL